MVDLQRVADQAQVQYQALAQAMPTKVNNKLDDLLESFGVEEVGNAATKEFVQKVIEYLRGKIEDSNMPEGLKELANLALDYREVQLDIEFPSSAEASEAVANTTTAGVIDDAAAAAVESAAPGSQTPAAQAESEAEAANEGTSTDASTGSAETESTSASGGDATTAADVIDDITANAGQDDEEEEEGNWLVVLAKGLAKIQSQFLDDAMKASETMQKQSGNAGSGESKEFLKAQADYTANIQLFTIFSNQTSTSIKTIGEAMAGISRKQ